MKETDIQNKIRIHVTKKNLGVLFRANVGEAWTGNDVIQNLDSVTIFQPRRLKTGLPVGFSDLFGVTTTGQAVFIEVKSPKGRLRTDQKRFLERMDKMGALVGVARSIEDAEQIFKGARPGL